jgi:hypothetical protein
VVLHLHVHIIPRKIGVAMKPPASVKEAPDVLAEQAKQLAAALRCGEQGADDASRTAGITLTSLGNCFIRDACCELV